MFGFLSVFVYVKVVLCIRSWCVFGYRFIRKWIFEFLKDMSSICEWVLDVKYFLNIGCVCIWICRSVFV